MLLSSNTLDLISSLLLLAYLRDTMDRLHIMDKIFKNFEIVKFITTALKSILKLVKLQSLVVKCCKM
jgi:hypothetical protein